MAGNPNVNQGNLNRLRASLVVPSYPQLNVTASYLGQAMMSLSFSGDGTEMIPTLVGTVTSPQPYQMASLLVNLLRTQNLAALYKQQLESLSTIGDVTVIPDASTLPNYLIHNAAIQTVRDLPITGNDAGYVVVITGYYQINNNLWNLV